MKWEIRCGNGTRIGGKCYPRNRGQETEGTGSGDGDANIIGNKMLPHDRNVFSDSDRRIFVLSKRTS